MAKIFPPKIFPPKIFPAKIFPPKYFLQNIYHQNIYRQNIYSQNISHQNVLIYKGHTILCTLMEKHIFFNSYKIQREPLKRFIDFSYQLIKFGDTNTFNLSFFPTTECYFYVKNIKSLTTLLFPSILFYQNLILFNLKLVPFLGSSLNCAERSGPLMSTTFNFNFLSQSGKHKISYFTLKGIFYQVVTRNLSLIL